MSGISRSEGELKEEIRRLQLRIDELEKNIAQYGQNPDVNGKSKPGSTSILSQNLIDIIPSPVFLTDINGIYLGCNKSFADFFGKEQSEITGKSVRDMGPEDITDKFLKKDEELLNNPGMQVYDCKTENSAGDIREIMFYKAFFPDDRGKAIGLIGIMVDVTDRRKAEQALLENEARFKAIFDTAKDAIFIKDKNLIYTHVNQGMIDLFDTPEEKLIGQDDVGLFGREEAGIIHESDRKVLSGEVVDEEHTRSINNKVFTFNVVKVPLRDDLGTITGICGIARDISHRKTSEKALQESEARYRAVSELTSDFAYSYQVISNDKVILEWATDAFTRISGFEQSDVVDSWYWAKIACSDDMALMVRRAEKLLSGHEDISEFKIITKNGIERWINDSALPIINEKTGLIERIIGAAMDITERKQSEEVLRRQHEALQRKNIALREVLNQIEEDEEVIKGEIAQIVDQVLMPALRKLINDDGKVNRVQYDVLQHGLSELIVSSGDILKIYSKLSPRETEICNLIRGGATSKEIADTLYITVGTVKKHRETIRRKLGLTRKDENLVSFLRRI